MGLGDRLLRGIRAYHGSPHFFDAFDSSKINTGEGAQAFGHGLYFAEKEGVAKDYRNKLTYRDFINQVQEPRTLGEAFFDVEAKEGGLIDGKVPFGPLRSLKTREQIADMFASGEASVFDLRPAMQKKIAEHMKPLGSMYEVNIAADPDDFLDWDKPLSEQGAYGKLKDYWDKRVGDPDIIAERLGITEQSTGSDLLNALGGGFYNRGGGGPEQQLRDVGVPGIKYLDQGSRGKGQVLAGDGQPTGYQNIDAEVAGRFNGSWDAYKAAYANTKSEPLKKAIAELDARGGVQFNREGGTSNYVIFDDKLISILRKYGLPISAAGVSALYQFAPQEAEAALHPDPGNGPGDRLLDRMAADERIRGAFEAAEQVPQESMEFFRGRGNLDPAQVPPRPELPFGETMAGATGEALYGVPVAGPALLGGAERLQSYATGEPLEDIETRQELFRRMYPEIAESGQAAGGMASLPVPGGLGAQLLASLGLLGADALVRR